MLTKQKFAELIRESKSGGDPESSSKYHDLVIFEVMELALNSLIARSFIENRNENSYNIHGDFVTPFPNVKVEFDAARNEKYSILPKRLISLPDNRGLRQVSPMQGQDHAFVKLPNGSNDTFSDLEAFNLDGRTGYYPERDKIYYRNLSDDITEVLVKMIASVDGLGVDEPLPIPAEYEADLFTTVKQMLEEEKATTQDKHTDSNNQQI